MYEEDGAVKKFFVSSGSVSINVDASVQILAEEVHPVDTIDAAAAKDIVAKAQAKVSSAADEVSDYCYHTPITLLSLFFSRLLRQRLRLNLKLVRLLLQLLSKYYHSSSVM